jgi:hypothetical protein
MNSGLALSLVEGRTAIFSKLPFSPDMEDFTDTKPKLVENKEFQNFLKSPR